MMSKQHRRFPWVKSNGEQGVACTCGWRSAPLPDMLEPRVQGLFDEHVRMLDTDWHAWTCAIVEGKRCSQWAYHYCCVVDIAVCDEHLESVCKRVGHKVHKIFSEEMEARLRKEREK